MDAQEKKALRKKLYVNREVQGALILRSVVHWCFYMCAILLAVVVWTAIRDPSQIAIKLVFRSFTYFSPAILASIVLLPLFIYDILKSSNRVAGPILRLQNEMARLARGEEVQPLKFRDGDHWMELADGFNTLAKRVQADRDALAELQSETTHDYEPVAG